jgi:hypothetical protein
MLPSLMGSVDNARPSYAFNFKDTAPAVHGQGVLGGFMDVVTFRCMACVRNLSRSININAAGPISAMGYNGSNLPQITHPIGKFHQMSAQPKIDSS